MQTIIDALVWRFVSEYSVAFGKRIEAISDQNMTAFRHYPWPGNIRELRNTVERAMILARGPELIIPVPKATSKAPNCSTKLEDVQKTHIRDVLETTGWRIRGTGGTAERLGLKPTTLETRMSKFGLVRPSAP